MSLKRQNDSTDGHNAKEYNVGGHIDKQNGLVFEEVGDNIWDDIEEEEYFNEDEVEGMMDEDEAEEDEQYKVYLPGHKLAADEELEVDQSAYDLLHTLNTEWPCLTFDFIKDQLGDNRANFPMTTYMVAGTQADTPAKNKLVMMKISDLNKTKFDDDSDDGMDEDDDGYDTDPCLVDRHIKHPFGGINRVRVSPHNAGIVSVWGDDGNVRMFNCTDHINALDVPPPVIPSENLKPTFTFSGHADEGFALDWSSVTPGRFLSGDCSKHIYLWEPDQTGSWAVNKTPYVGHESSVEDLQWSPSEPNAFASCSSDKTVKIWDARQKAKAALSTIAHDSDVNVISWNRIVNYLMVSGGDDGQFKCWDLRMFGGKQPPVATFKWHNAPITSIEWHPSDDSVLVVAGEDDQVTLWDMSVEADSEVRQDMLEQKVPPQLLFIHQGQQHIKEVHWHRQIPGMLVSTAASGFNIFKTISV